MGDAKLGLRLDWGNDQSERPQAATSEACWPSHQDQSHHLARSTISDELWQVLAPLIPKHVKTHRFGGGLPRVPDRTCANGIFYVLRTGCQWKALDATGICSGSTAHLRFQEWVAAGVFLELWRVGLERYDELKGLDWSWLSMDGAMTKSPLGGGKNRPQPH